MVEYTGGLVSLIIFIYDGDINSYVNGPKVFADFYFQTVARFVSYPLKFNNK